MSQPSSQPEVPGWVRDSGSATTAGHLEDQDGVPFFYLGDTAWTLFKRLDRDDVELYLSNRAEKGFTVIQAYVLRGLEVTNLEGELPLVDRDPTQLNEGFFGNVDRIVRRANELGLVMGMVATMGEHVKRKPTAERFKDRNEQIFNVENAYRFGELLGERYRDDCVIWLLGGDRNPSEEDIATWDSMAYGMKAGSAGAHLVSYHSGGGHSSSEYFHDKDWLDFNTVQSRHRSQDANYPLITADYALTPDEAHPGHGVPLRGPPGRARHRYPGRSWRASSTPTSGSDAFDAREGAYWAVFAGAAGHGYGHNDLWQMADSPPGGQHPRLLLPAAAAASRLVRVHRRPGRLRHGLSAAADGAPTVVRRGCPTSRSSRPGRGAPDDEDRRPGAPGTRRQLRARLPDAAAARSPSTSRCCPAARSGSRWYDPRTGRFAGHRDDPASRASREFRRPAAVTATTGCWCWTTWQPACRH